MSTPAGLWQGPFRWFYLGRIIDLTGSAMTPVALSLAVLAHTGSPTQMGIVLAANVTPTLAFLLLGGVLADRWQRRTIVQCSALLAACTQAAMAALLFQRDLHLPTMASLAALSGLIGAFNTPALRGIVAELVASRDLQRANALLASGRNATRIVGPTLAASLVASIGGGWALAIDACTFVLAAACFTHLPARVNTRPKTRLSRDLRAGWRAYLARRWVWTISLCSMLVNLAMVGPWQILGAVLVTERYGAPVWGALLSLRTAAMLVTSAALIHVVLKNPLRTGVLFGTLTALPLLALATHAPPLWLVASVIGAAIGMCVATISYEVCLQRAIPPTELSRVTSFDDLFAFAAVPLSQLLAGPAAALIGTERLLAICAAAIAVLQVLPLTLVEVRRGGPLA